VSVAGQWTLTIEQCGWELRNNHEVLAHSESGDPTMRRALRVLEGQALAAVHAEPVTGATDFEFDLGTTLSTKPYAQDSEPGEHDELWDLRSPDDNYIAIRGDGTFSVHDGSANPDGYEWLAIRTP